MRKHIALTGFMAAGKSTIGKKLARRLGIKFYDIDDAVTATHGSIDDIFAQQGEKQFRKYEFDAIDRVLEDGEAGVIALGGGAVTYDESLHLLEKRTYRVFIKVAPEQVLGRLRRSSQPRPLLGPNPSLAKIKALYAQRMPRYSHADHVVDADGLSTTQIVDDIVEWVRRKNIAL